MTAWAGLGLMAAVFWLGEISASGQQSATGSRKVETGGPPPSQPPDPRPYAHRR